MAEGNERAQTGGLGPAPGRLDGLPSAVEAAGPTAPRTGEAGADCPGREHSFVVLVPTLNRPEDVQANVRALVAGIPVSLGRWRILLSENGSDPELRLTADDLRGLQETSIARGVAFQHVYRPKRLHPARHMHVLAAEADDWQLWVGDDDCLAPGFLHRAASLIAADAGIAAVCSRYHPCTREEFLRSCRSFAFDLGVEWEREPFRLHRAEGARPDGWFGPVMQAGLRGHQLSGLFLRQDVMAAVRSQINPENMYPWISYLGAAPFFGSVVEFGATGVAVTSNTPKHFSYGRTGLQPDIVEAFGAIPGVPAGGQARFLRRVASHPEVVWRMHHTARFFAKRCWNYVRLAFDRRMPRSVWVAGFLGHLRWEVGLFVAKVRFKLFAPPPAADATRAGAESR